MSVYREPYLPPKLSWQDRLREWVQCCRAWLRCDADQVVQTNAEDIVARAAMVLERSRNIDNDLHTIATKIGELQKHADQAKTRYW